MAKPQMMFALFAGLSLFVLLVLLKTHTAT